MSDKLKIALNSLQLRIDKDSDKTLLIFDDQWFLDKYKRAILSERCGEHYLTDKVLITMDDLVNNNGLTGRRFRNYRFMP